MLGGVLDLHLSALGGAGESAEFLPRVPWEMLARIMNAYTQYSERSWESAGPHPYLYSLVIHPHSPCPPLAVSIPLAP